MRRRSELDSPIDVLVVCTGNFCRSPLAEAFLLLNAPTALRIASAGVAPVKLKTPHPHVTEVLATSGAAPAVIATLRPKKLRRQDVERARLILGASSEHRRAVIELDRTAAERAYTFKEFARLVTDTTPTGTGPVTKLDSLIATAASRLQADFDAREVNFRESDDDLDDPLNEPVPAFERCYDAIKDALSWVSRLS